jgi:predicted ATPase/transcriptional regulator with XRE-family HTH domain
MSSRPAGEVQQLGTILATLRARAGLSQEELAERAGLSVHAISALERGTRTRPYPHTVRSLADALDLVDDERVSLIASVPSRRRPDPDHAVVAARPALADVAPRSAGLVVPPTRLFGRDEDVTAVLALARSGSSRLITLTGMGGVGKTRLVSLLSEELAGDYPDGVVQVALAALADPAEVIPAIGRALRLAGAEGVGAHDVVAAHLAELRVLLVLDNFEHLLPAAPDVAQLVSLCPGLTVLVSSRSPLRVRGEREYAVAPLALPAGEVTTVDELDTSPAGALALDRARAVSPQLEITGEDAHALGELCVRLAGLPLAIELATARLRLLSPHALLERLDDMASSTGARDLPERQRTMQATLDWSFELLTPDQQALFTLFGIFRSGATLETLEEVAAASWDSGDADGRDVLALLEQLVEHSLVVVRPGPDGRHRYDMLEPVAQYTRTLLAGPDAARASRAHAQVFATMAERAAAGYEHADQVAWLARTEADEANLLIAIRRSLDNGDGDAAARITWSLWLYWWLRGQHTVGRQSAEQCLTLDLPPALLARVRLAAATMAYAAGDFDASATHWQAAFQLGTQEHDAEVACKSMAGLGLAALAAGDVTKAEHCFRESLPLCREAREAGIWMTSLVHVWLGTVLLLQGDEAGAATEVEHGLAVARARGDRLTTYVALYNLAQTAIAADEHADARGHLEEGIRLSEQTQDLANLAYFLDSLAVVESQDGHSERVAVLLGAAQSLRESVGALVYAYYLPDESLRAEAEQTARADLGVDAYDDAVDAARGMDPAAVVSFALGAPV